MQCQTLDRSPRTLAFGAVAALGTRPVKVTESLRPPAPAQPAEVKSTQEAMAREEAYNEFHQARDEHEKIYDLGATEAGI